jgi:hypothetical protein
VTPEVAELPASVTDVAVQVSAPPVAVAPGFVVFSVTVTVAVEVQPFTGFVTVKVYEPPAVTEGFCKADVKLPGPAQRYVTPEVVELPVSVTDGEAHVMVPLPPAAAPGANESFTTATLAIDVHPFDGSVVINVYVPEAPTDGFCKVDVKLPGPVQLYVTPDVEELPERETAGLPHPRVSLTIAAAPGVIVSLATMAVAVEIQPLAGSVTVSEYVPAVLTVGFCSIDVKLPGPVQL